ncbi:LHFPL tetraspan subfamily member 6 protein-like [Biomphalaria glabrata]|uniref:LHFPL tetraspan subfamily member 6 protein-like n=2 Tax=Biomphalaria glabrata TaxID=6526 RepID=A0A9W2YZH9_BIOGL|nr:LHFPL tetraspan subfamily member 6 protein-like [Biomphalaria glabrata]
MSTTCIGKLWVVTSFAASIASAVGYYFPYWLEGFYIHESGLRHPMYFGVFRRCSYPQLREDGNVAIVDECGRYTTFEDIPSLYWQISTITVGIGACLSLLLSLTAVVTLCVSDIITVRVARLTGVVQLFAGLLLGGGLAVYPNGWDTIQVRQACGGTSGVYQLGGCSLCWAFYLTAAGAGVTMFCSSLVCHAYKNKVNNRASTYSV